LTNLKEAWIRKLLFDTQKVKRKNLMLKNLKGRGLCGRRK